MKRLAFPFALVIACLAGIAIDRIALAQQAALKRTILLGRTTPRVPATRP